MREEKRIVKNTLWLTLGKVLGDLIIFFFLMSFGRTFGAEVLGKYAFAMSLAGFLTVFASLGFNTLTIREVSKDKSQTAKYIGNFLLTQGVISIFIWGLIVLGIFISSLDGDSKLIVILITGYFVFYKLTNLLHCGFMAHEEMQYPAFLELYHRLFILILGISLIMLFHHPVITLVSYPVSAFTMFVLGFWLFISKYGWPDLKIDIFFIKGAFIKALPFFIMILLTQTYERISILLLMFLKGEEATGIYSASDRLWVTFTAGLAMFQSALFPVMARFSVDSKEKLFQLTERAIRLLVILLLPISLLVFILSHEILLVTFGKEFLNSVPVLRILCWALILIGVNHVIGNFFIVTDHQKVYLKMLVFVYISFLILCFILIGKYSYLGLAYARILHDILLFAVAFFYLTLTRKINTFHWMRLSAAPIISCLFAYLVFYFLSGFFNVWMILPFVVGTYTILIFVLKGVQLHDFVFLKNVLFKNESKGELAGSSASEIL